MKTIDTVVKDVYNLMLTQEVEGDLQKVADTIGKEVSEAVVDALTPREKQTHLRMSGIGRCERAQWYQCKGYDAEEIEGNVYLTFLTGHIMEAVILGLVELAGHTVTNKQAKHTLEGINGSQDCHIDGELVDVKTASAWSYDNKFAEDGIKEDTFGYIKQLSAYGKAEGKDSAYFLAYNKNKSEMKLCKQELETDVDTFIVDLKAKMELDTPPMRIARATSFEKSGRERLSMTCSFCGYKEHCYDGHLEAVDRGKITNYYVDTEKGNF